MECLEDLIPSGIYIIQCFVKFKFNMPLCEKTQTILEKDCHLILKTLLFCSFSKRN